MPSRFNNNATGDWNAFNNSMLSGGGLEQLASSLLDSNNSANSKLIDSYIKKIKDESERLRKQSISDAQRIKKIREASEAAIINMMDKSMRKRLSILEQERKFADMSAKQQGEYIVNQRKALEERKAALEDEKNLVDDRLKEVDKNLASAKLNKEQRDLLEKEKEELEKKQSEFLQNHVFLRQDTLTVS